LHKLSQFFKTKKKLILTRIRKIILNQDPSRPKKFRIRLDPDPEQSTCITTAASAAAILTSTFQRIRIHLKKF